MSGGHHGSRHMGHLQSTKVYLLVLVALFILTVTTVAVSTYDFGHLNDVVAIGIASIKAVLVLAFFMHGRFESKLIWAFVFYPLVLLGILVGALFLDYGFRNKDEFKDWDQLQSITLKAHHGEQEHGGEAASHEANAEAPHSESMPEAVAPEVAHEAVAAGETPSVVAWEGVVGDAAAGKAKAQSICIACHLVDGVGNALPTAPAFEVSANTATINPDYLRKWLKNPPEVKPGTLMPPLGLTDGEIENLIAFLHTYKK